MFTCARIFGDHMILQRNLPVAVFGTAESGAVIHAQIAGSSASCTAADGKWLLFLPAMDSREAQTLTVRCGQEVKTFCDVLFGEVWLAGGQSNMEFVLENARSGAEEIPQACDAALRYYHTVKTATQEGRARAEAEVPAGWVLCSPETARQFSAVGYHFAKRLRAGEQVPVGIIGCNWGGTSASCWMSEETLVSDPKTAVYMQEYQAVLSGRTADEYERQKAEYAAQIEDYNARMAAVTVPKEDADAYLAATSGIAYPWPPPMGEDSFLRPCGLYSTMLAHVAPYTLRGVIWYQGESDEGHAALYGKLFSNMIANWRMDFRRDDLFFAFVQLTSFACEDADQPRWGYLRRQQAWVRDNVPFTAMAVTYDVGEKENIHPIDKKTVGDRLADQVLAAVYRHPLDARLAKPVKKETEGSRMILHFDTELCVRGDAAKGFQICGDDGKYAWAQVRISGARAVLTAEEIALPVHARYAHTNWTEANVYQANGIPLPPFEA